MKVLVKPKVKLYVKNNLEPMLRRHFYGACIKKHIDEIILLGIKTEGIETFEAEVKQGS